MQLVAVKRISGRLPLGAIFEQSGRRAAMLIAIGLAKPYAPPAEPMRRGGRRSEPISPVLVPEPAA